MTINDSAEIVSYNIVVLGSFNPAIFHPAWFERNNLIRPEEATEADVKMVQNQVAIFTAGGFSFQITAGRFIIDTADASMVHPLRDLAMNIFQILEHSPIEAFGFNVEKHYRVNSEDDWHAFGDHFVPKASWNQLLQSPGMRSLTVEGKRSGSEARIQIKTEPSAKISTGVFIHVNEHHGLNSDDGQRKNLDLYLQSLRADWEDFLTYCGDVATHLFREGCGNPRA